MANTPSVPPEAHAGDGDDERDRRRAALARWRASESVERARRQLPRLRAGRISGARRRAALLNSDAPRVEGDGRSGEISNSRPLAPEASALPGCATLRPTVSPLRDNAAASCEGCMRRGRLYSGHAAAPQAKGSGAHPQAVEGALRRAIAAGLLASTASTIRGAPPWPAKHRFVIAGVMGRRQVVRQRILIPSYPGSNPGAPANVRAA